MSTQVYDINEADVRTAFHDLHDDSLHSRARLLRDESRGSGELGCTREDAYDQLDELLAKAQEKFQLRLNEFRYAIYTKGGGVSVAQAVDLATLYLLTQDADLEALMRDVIKKPAPPNYPDPCRFLTREERDAHRAHVAGQAEEYEKELTARKEKRHELQQQAAERAEEVRLKEWRDQKELERKEGIS